MVKHVDYKNEINITLSEWFKIRNIIHFNNCTNLDKYVNVDNSAP